MEIPFYRGSKPNLGDDLNDVLWCELLPKDVLEASGFVLVAIGSILTDEWLAPYRNAESRVLVLGTGTSYGRAPEPVAGWRVLAVRGPLTASVLGMPEKAVTDGAILLADSRVLVGAERNPTDTLFIPHHRSIRRTPWEAIASEAGMRFVSPQWPVGVALEAFSSARLVVTEAMHGAIIADALRIPWIPIAISPMVDEFKWRDWLGSINLEFSPVAVPAGDPRDLARYRRMSRVLDDYGVSGHANVPPSADEAFLRAHLERRFSPELRARILEADRGRRIHKVGVATRLPASAAYRRRAVRALRNAARAKPLLSNDNTHFMRLEQMRGAVGELIDLVRRG